MLDEKCSDAKPPSDGPSVPVPIAKLPLLRRAVARAAKTLLPAVKTLCGCVSEQALSRSIKLPEERTLRRLPLTLTALGAVGMHSLWRLTTERLDDPKQEGGVFALTVRTLTDASAMNTSRLEGAVFAWFCRFGVPPTSVDKGLQVLLEAADEELRPRSQCK